MIHHFVAWLNDEGRWCWYPVEKDDDLPSPDYSIAPGKTLAIHWLDEAPDRAGERHQIIDRIRNEEIPE